jgi:carbonic anhydrase
MIVLLIVALSLEVALAIAISKRLPQQRRYIVWVHCRDFRVNVQTIVVSKVAALQIQHVMDNYVPTVYDNLIRLELEGCL